MTKLIDIYEELDSDKIVYLEDIFDYLDETEVHIIRTALGFSRTKSYAEGSYLLQGLKPHKGNNLNALYLGKILDSAQEIIFGIFEKKSNPLAVALRNVFRVFFNLNDAESLSRFDQVEDNYKHIKKHGEEKAIWLIGKSENWLERIQEDAFDLDLAEYYQGLCEHNAPVKEED